MKFCGACGYEDPDHVRACPEPLQAEIEGLKNLREKLLKDWSEATARAAAAELQNRALEARVEILSRKPLDTGLDNETWRDGEHCVCNFDPNSHRVRKVCQFHETIYKEWAQAKDKVEATDRLNGELRKAAEIGAKWMRWWLEQQECDCEVGHTCGRKGRLLELSEIDSILEQMEKPKCVHDGGAVPCDHQKPCPDHTCACGKAAVTNPGDKCLRCMSTEKRVDGQQIKLQHTKYENTCPACAAGDKPHGLH